jgi:pteridine reductase
MCVILLATMPLHANEPRIPYIGLVVPLAQSAPPPDSVAPKPERLPEVATWVLLLVATILALVLLALGSLTVHRRRMRERTLEEERRQRAATAAKVRTDPWAEAGRRAPTPQSSPEPSLEESPTVQGTPTPLAVKGGSSSAPASRPLALVTGAARRVGRAVALELARAGCDVIFTYNSSEPEARALASELAELGCTASFQRLDLSDLDCVQSFASEQADLLPRLDILVHNASIYRPTNLDDLSVEELSILFRVNTFAPLLLSAKLAPRLRESVLPGGGCIVALVDIHAMGRPRRGFAAYSMSKAALTDMVYCLARDLAPDIRVNAVAPGVVAWPEEGSDANPEHQARYLRRIPLGRAGTPEDAAKAVKWLAMDAPYITGEVIRVDGGRWLA